ncbi:MAG: tRNA preQ1(34) S-adenosylmethionine ribosyltransferase-isomerase QueA [Deltaproteobacteria bacterium]|nr:MAG: tRNA preQ1(34) S-adenosylmethionine ribosyltransferase-isomerase QueA [Deltaproteobacteria bacterium]
MDTKILDYHLPEELIAQYPSPRRDESRLLVFERKTGEIRHRLFRDIVDELTENDLLVLNDTRVIRARVLFRKPTGGRVEVFFLHQVEGTLWECLVRPAGRMREGAEYKVSDKLRVRFVRRTGPGSWLVDAETAGDIFDVLDEIGLVPLPPYIRREAEEVDGERYQTVFAEKRGSVAAPTAGLHFTEELLGALNRKGVEIVRVTLNVGYGTFAPIKTERVEDHDIHPEKYAVSEESAASLIEAKEKGKRIVAVGTTVVRVLETVFRGTEVVNSLEGETRLFIYPGYRFGFVDALITNFHLPRSSLLALVMAFAGVDETMRCYETAIRERYRFFSYGDAMFIR